MKTQYLELQQKDVSVPAETLFLQNCGILSDSDRHRRMYEEGMAVLSRGQAGIRIRSVLASCSSSAWRDRKIHAGGFTFTCPAFSRIADENVIQIWFYMITAGECSCAVTEPISRRLFADVWGTAYVDAGRILLEDRIRAQAGSGHLSRCFGPGFFGMPTSENVKLAKLLDSRKLGIEVKPSGIMVPVKSCAGIYLTVKDPGELPGAGCMTCRGSSKNCALCNLGKGGH